MYWTIKTHDASVIFIIELCELLNYCVCELFSEQEIAKRLQEEEEMEMRRQRAEAGHHENDCVSPLCEGKCVLLM